MSNIIVKHRHGLVTDCHHLPMVPIVPQSAPMVSVADVSVKLYLKLVHCLKIMEYLRLNILTLAYNSLQYTTKQNML